MSKVAQASGSRWRLEIASGPGRASAALIVAALSACTAAKPVHFANPADLARALRPGDTVRVTAKEGTVSKLTVVAVDASEIRGAERTIRTEDVAQVEVLEPDLGGTATTVWAGLGLAAGIILLLALI